MLGTELAKLLETEHSGVGDAIALVDELDAALVTGYSRPDDARDAALARLAAAFASTPLADRLAAAAQDLASGQVTEEHLLSVAAGRSALMGSIHDALVSRLDDVTGRERSAGVDESGHAERPTVPAYAACRAWLTELAVGGLNAVDEDFIASAGTIIEGLWQEPVHRRLAMILDGWCTELRAKLPIAALAEVPVRRWADLWTRARILSEANYPQYGATDRVSGRLLPVAVDVFDHDTLFGVVVHAVLESGESSRLVRTTVSAPKVEVIAGAAMWDLITGADRLRAALAEDRALDLTDMPITAYGDLLWDDAAVQLGGDADPMATARMALPSAAPGTVPPLDRHPALIAEPVFVESYRVVKGEPLQFDLGGATLDVNLKGLPAAGPVTDKNVAASKACIGMLRWDNGRWSLSPVAVLTNVKRQPTVLHTGQWAQGATDPKVARKVERDNVVNVLRERAGRLLRT